MNVMWDKIRENVSLERLANVAILLTAFVAFGLLCCELQRLLSFGLAEIDLGYKESKKRDEHGNWFRYRAKVRDIHGAQVGRWAWDVFLLSAH